MKHQLSNMLSVCAVAFKWNLDVHWEPYFMHCIRVMQRVALQYPDDEELQIIALAHDLVEDTDVTCGTLVRMWCSTRVVDWVAAVTRQEAEAYDDFIDRILRNRDAIIVKLADIEDNLDVRRIKWNTPKDNERTIKYINAYITLKSKLNAK